MCWWIWCHVCVVRCAQVFNGACSIVRCQSRLSCDTRSLLSSSICVFFSFFFLSLCLSLYLLRSFSLQCGTSDYESWVFQWLIVITGNKIAIFYSNDSALQTLEFFFKANYVYRLIFFFFFFFILTYFFSIILFHKIAYKWPIFSSWLYSR